MAALAGIAGIRRARCVERSTDEASIRAGARVTVLSSARSAGQAFALARPRYCRHGWVAELANVGRIGPAARIGRAANRAGGCNAVNGRVGQERHVGGIAGRQNFSHIGGGQGCVAGPIDRRISALHEDIWRCRQIEGLAVVGDLESGIEANRSLLIDGRALARQIEAATVGRRACSIQVEHGTILGRSAVAPANIVDARVVLRTARVLQGARKAILVRRRTSDKPGSCDDDEAAGKEIPNCRTT